MESTQIIAIRFSQRTQWNYIFPSNNKYFCPRNLVKLVDLTLLVFLSLKLFFAIILPNKVINFVTSSTDSLSCGIVNKRSVFRLIFPYPSCWRRHWTIWRTGPFVITRFRFPITQTLSVQFMPCTARSNLRWLKIGKMIKLKQHIIYCLTQWTIYPSKSNAQWLWFIKFVGAHFVILTKSFFAF